MNAKPKIKVGANQPRGASLIWWSGVGLLTLLVLLGIFAPAPGLETGDGIKAARAEEEIIRIQVREAQDESAVNKLPEPAPAPNQQATDSTSRPAEAAPSPAKKQIMSGGSPAGFVLPISANYRRTLGFEKYARTMLEIGGVFLVFDGEKIRAQVDVLHGTIKSVDVRQLSGMSPRSREINDIALTTCLEIAREKLGPGYYSVILLLPTKVDERIQDAANRMLTTAGVSAADVELIEADYREISGQVELRFNRVRLQNLQNISVAGNVAL